MWATPSTTGGYLAPGAAMELELGMELHVAEEPSYARPWGGGAAL